MKIAVVTSTLMFKPQADGFAEAMRNKGHDARAISVESLQQNKTLAFDAALFIGTGESLHQFLAIVKAPVKCLYIIESLPALSETDRVMDYKLTIHRPYIMEFNCVFVHTPRSVPVIQSLGVPRVEDLNWPHFPSIYHPIPSVEKDLDVLFIGFLNSEHRKEVIEHAATKYKIALANKAYHQESTALYARAKIALNIHFTPLKAFEARVSEVLGCGAFLLSETLDPADRFRDGEHLAIFNDKEHFLSQLEYYLHHPELRERIARTGHERIKQYDVSTQTDKILNVMHEAYASGSAQQQPKSTPQQPVQNMAPSNVSNVPPPTASAQVMAQIVEGIVRWLIDWVQPRHAFLDSQLAELIADRWNIKNSVFQQQPNAIYDIVIVDHERFAESHLLSLNYDGFCIVRSGDGKKVEGVPRAGFAYLDLPGVRIYQRTSGAIWLRTDPILKKLYEHAAPISLRNTPQQHHPRAYRPPAEILDHFTPIEAICRLARVEKYLELGVRDSPTLRAVSKIASECHGVDIQPCQLDPSIHFHQETTDSFFAGNRLTFDAIFIDADHDFPQVQLDLTNSLKAIKSGGCIFLHDTYPNNSMLLGKEWCSDSCKITEYLRLYLPHVQMLNIPVVPGLVILRAP